MAFIGYIFIIFVRKKVDVIALIFIIISIPLVIVSCITLVAKLFVDKRKIKNKIIPVLSSNYIIMNFFTNTKRIHKQAIRLNSDGRSLDIGKRTYIVDKKTIWHDSKNRPNSFYLPEIPNPIKFNMEKTIDTFIQAIREKKLDKAIDSDGELVDISFSSTNLQLFKQSKIFDELNKNPSADKMQMALIGIIALLIIVLVIVILV